MTIKNTAASEVRREPLSRERILRAAVRFIDEHGLETLSMHKLGATLDARGMSLYNHVENKADVLDGVVALLWEQVEAEAAPGPDWRENYRRYGRAIRDVIRSHPHAAPLATSRPVMADAALRLVKANIEVALDAGLESDHAYALLRTVNSYALGHALVHTNWELGCSSCAPAVSDLLRPDTPAELAAVAEVFCGRSDPDAEFELGLERMLRGC